MMQTRRLLAAAVLLLLWSLGSSCAQPAPAGVSPSPEEDERLTTTAVNLVLMRSKIYISSFSELASYARVIVLGRVVSKEGIYNGSRLGDDHSKTGDHFSIAQVYLVEVERYLKGEGPAALHLAQGEGRLPRRVTPEETPHPDEIEQAKAAAVGKYYLPLKLGNRYLFFAAALSASVKKSSRNVGGALVGVRRIGIYPRISPEPAAP